MSEKQSSPDFLWGGGFAANQMEGAYLEEGKGWCLADINEYRKDIPLDKKKQHRSQRIKSRMPSMRWTGIFPNAGASILSHL